MRYLVVAPLVVMVLLVLGIYSQSGDLDRCRATLADARHQLRIEIRAVELLAKDKFQATTARQRAVHEQNHAQLGNK